MIAFLNLLQVLALSQAAFLNINWNLNWLRQTDLGHADSHDSKRPHQRIEPLALVFDTLNQVATIGGPCDACKLSLRVFKESLTDDHTTLASIFYGICGDRAPPGGLFQNLCENLHLYQSPILSNGFSFLPDFANALSELDPNGIDGEYLCHYMFSNACPRPATPQIDYTKYWPAKPKHVAKTERSNNTFRALHVSDVHLSANYTEHAPANCLGAMCCDSFAFQNPLQDVVPAPKYGHWRCDCPQSLLESAVVDASQRTQNDFRFALFTGDMVDHNPVLITKEETYAEEERTLRALKTYLGSIPVFPVLGNHDSYPYSQEPPASSKYADRTAFNLELMEHLWSDYGWIPGKARKQFRKTHGAYATQPVPGLKVITLNSNYWYRWNFYNYVGMRNPDPSGVIAFLIAELLDCEERGIKAWVQAHVPPGGLADEALPPAASFFTATLERFSDVITGQFFGHTHLDEFSVLYANNATERSESAALNVAWVAPSITPYTDLNPGWRYYEVDDATFEIVDAVTVYADIEPGFNVPWSETGNLEWRVLYSARDQYGEVLGWPASEPLNGKFWHRVANEFLYNAEFSEQFVRRSYRESSRAPECSDYDCRSERYCYATSMTPDQVADCHERHATGDRWKSGRHRIGKSANRGWFRKKLSSPHGMSLYGVPTFPMPRPKRHVQQKLS